MKRLFFNCILAMTLVVSFASTSFCYRLPDIEIPDVVRISTSGASSSNTAPVFDPLNSFQVVLNQTAIFTIGATDSENQTMSLSANGDTLYCVGTGCNPVYITRTVAGRIEAAVQVRGTTLGTHYVSINVQDSSGANTVVNLPIEVVSAANNQPIIFGPVSSQTIKVGDILDKNVYISDNDPEMLNLAATLPTNAVMQVTSNVNGYYAVRIQWQPASVDVGTHDIQLLATDTGSGRNNSSIATLRVKVDATANTAPVFDPLNSFQVVLNQTAIFTIGATDSENQTMSLSANGDTLYCVGTGCNPVYITRTVAGRIEAAVQVRGTTLGTHYVSINVQDSSGANTVVNLPIEVVSAANNQPIIFGPVSSQTIKVGDILDKNVYISDNDPEMLNLAATLPTNAVMQVTSNVNGYYAVRIQWQPASVDVGTHDIQLLATDTGSGRNNSSIATLRVKVDATANTAPVFDPLNSFQVVLNQTAIFTIGATDSENQTMSLSANGDTLYCVGTGCNPVYITRTVAGRIEAAVQVRGTTLGTHYVSINVQDSSGANTVVNLPIEVVSAANNQPIIFGPVSSQTIKVGDILDKNVYISDNDPEMLNLAATLPTNAVMQVTSNVNGYYAVRIQWQPASVDVGTHDIQLLATDTGSGRNNSSIATLRVKVDATANTAPVFDPLNSFQVVLNQTAIFTIGATDSENQTMSLSANGDTLYCVGTGCNPVYITRTVAGRIEAAVQVRGTTLGTHYVSINVQDSSGANTVVNLPIEVVSAANNQPIIFGPVSSQTIKVGDILDKNVYISDNDPEMLNLAATLPTNAVMQVTSNVNGYYAVRIQWQPASVDVGTHDIQLLATDTGSGRNNSSIATLRVKVDATANTAPVFDPLNSFQVVLNQTAIFTIGATDSENQTMSLSANGDTLYCVGTGCNPVYITRTVAGRIEAAVQVRGTTLGTHYVSINVQDSSGANTVVNLPIEVVSAANNQPIIFGPVSSQTIKVGDILDKNVYISDNDPEMLNLAATLPTNAVMQVTSNVNGYYAVRIQWQPASVDVGTHDIQLLATDTGSGRNNSSIATLRVKVDATANTAPVFDPLNSFQVVLNQTAIFTIGATDSENQTMSLSANGDTLYCVGTGCNPVYITRTVAGRIEAAVQVRGTTLGTHYVSINVQDSSGANTVVNLPIEVVSAANNQPIIFGPVSSQTIKVGDILDKNVYISDNDPEMLNLAATLPTNAVMQVTSNVNGYYAVRIQWQPASVDVGTHDIQLLATDTGSGRNNSSIATLRIKVDPISGGSGGIRKMPI